MAAVLGLCAECARSGVEQVRELIEAAHGQVRAKFSDPPKVPREKGFEACRVCANACSPAEGDEGFCAIRSRKDGEMGLHNGPSLSWYYDRLPTNCVGDFVCAGGTGAGYPEFAVTDGPELGYKNLAVFYHSCSFNCLFCQNWHFREDRRARGGNISASELAAAADDRTTCICYFGGDPGTQIEHALHASREARKRAEKTGRPLRICWETNGSVTAKYFEQMIELSLESGGCVKVDLKAFDENLHKALTGVSNQRTLRNFETLAAAMDRRPVPSLAVASTLMVPGYVDEAEVGKIAGFLAGLNPHIPYSLLAFHPDFSMPDLPATPRKTAEACLDAAKRAGLRRIHIGNMHLL